MKKIQKILEERVFESFKEKLLPFCLWNKSCEYSFQEKVKKT